MVLDAVGVFLGDGGAERRHVHVPRVVLVIQHARPPRQQAPEIVGGFPGVAGQVGIAEAPFGFQRSLIAARPHLVEHHDSLSDKGDRGREASAAGMLGDEHGRRGAFAITARAWRT